MTGSDSPNMRRYERADRAFHDVCQTFLREFQGDVDLYPEVAD